MTTYICFDFGNTTLKFAVYAQGVLIDKQICHETGAAQTISLAIKKYTPTAAILCSVIHQSLEIEKVLATIPTLLTLNSSTPLPFESEYLTPETLGPDRLALIAGVEHLFPNANNLVISLGTCITYNFISNHIFKGGAISPGIDMRFKSMHAYTDKLPLVTKQHHFDLMGTNTETSLQSGVMHGILAEIQSSIDFYEKTYGKINAILTGGDISYFETKIKKRIFADRNILFHGLYEILKFNV